MLRLWNIQSSFAIYCFFTFLIQQVSADITAYPGSSASITIANGLPTPSPLAKLLLPVSTASIPGPANYTLVPPLPIVIDGIPQFSLFPPNATNSSTYLRFTNSTASSSSATKAVNGSTDLSSNSFRTSTKPASLISSTTSTLHTQANEVTKRQSGDFWLLDIQHGVHPNAPSGYPWFRNVMDYGATGDGSTDDYNAITKAATTGPRCIPPCNSTSVLGAVVYFPPGTYMVSQPIYQDFYTQFVGDPNNMATIKGTSDFSGIALVDTNLYIPNENGEEWYQNQNQFFRQIRNLQFDLTEMQLLNPDLPPTGIHWQVAQSTSLQNLKFIMPPSEASNYNKAVGIFTENGSGGFMSDLIFQGGNIGMRIGSQQFTIRNLQFTSCITAIQHIWNWAFTWKGISVFSCYFGIDVTSGGSTGPNFQPTASITVVDSVFASTGVAVFTAGYTQVIFDNVETTGVTFAIQSNGGQVYYNPGNGVTQSYALGTVCFNITGVCETYNGALSPAPSKPQFLLDGSGSYFVRSKPQYQDLSASSFINVRNSGAVGNGVADDTKAVNSALQQSASTGNPVWFPMGIYQITGTITIPVGARVVGESWPQLRAAGSFFSNPKNPQVFVKVGNAGDSGVVEISDMLFTTQGATAGAVVVEWNVKESSQGSAAMWDSHIRIGGAVGTNLQSNNCPPFLGPANPNCVAASLMLRLTEGSSAYLENVWAWTADHDMDIPAQTQVDIYTGRGVLIESQGPTWLYGTASEHAVLYQYQISNASNIFMGFAQTESPYFQSSPPAPAPFTNYLTFPNDPTFSNCASNSVTCAMSWALRIISSTNVFLYGGGFYSWFQQYAQECIPTETCQDALIDTSFSQGIWLYDVVTKGAIQVISPEGGEAVTQTETQAYYLATVMAWLGLATSGGNIGGTGSNGIGYFSPDCASIVPIPSCTTLPSPDATFTITPQCETAIAAMPVSGAQNVPQGPSACDETCDLFRLLTDTCCGIGGDVCNPIVIEPDTPLPAQMGLPAGFTPTSPFVDSNGTTHSAGVPLPSSVTVDSGTNFSSPFLIPANETLAPPGSVEPYEHETPGGVSILPLPCTTVPASATFTMSSACLPGITALPAGTSQNKPPGPSNCHDNCDLLRRLTGTCCGFGGWIISPIIIPPIILPWPIILPIGFIPPFDIDDPDECDEDAPAGVPLTSPITLPAGFQLPSVLDLPADLPLVDDEEDECGDEPEGGLPDPISFISEESFSFIIDSEATSDDIWEQIYGIAIIFDANDNVTSTSAAPPTPTNPSVSGYTYLGCWSDASTRTLPEASEQEQYNSVEECQYFCAQQNYNVFGVEFSTQCYCGTAVETDGGATEIDPSNCNMACGGDEEELCGGTWAMNVYSSSVTPAGPTPAPTVDPLPGYTYLGCFPDSTDPRILGGTAITDPDMSVELCVDVCEDNSYSGFGVEDGNQCFCGDEFATTVSSVDDSNCNYRCPGHGSTQCGGFGYINVYAGPSFTTATPTPTPTQGIMIWAVIETVGDGEGTTADYWAVTDITTEDTVGECDAVYGQELLQSINEPHYDDLPASWAFTAPIHTSLTSCTYTASQTAAAAAATVTGFLNCPSFPSPVPCLPVNNAPVGSCLAGGTIGIAPFWGIQFGGGVATPEELTYCLF